MGWFDEQIRQRRQKDEAVLEEAFLKIAESVIGRRMALGLQDDALLARNAIDNVLNYYHIRPKEIPDNLRSLDEQLEYLLRPHGIMRRSIHLEKGWRRDACGAMLGRRTDNGKIVALIPGKTSGYYFQDEETGKTVKLSGKNEELIGQEAIAFYIPFPLEKMTMVSLLRYICGMVSGDREGGA